MRISKFTRIVLMDEGQRYEVAIHELDHEDLDQLALVAAVESREQYLMPTPIDARAVEVST